MWLRVLGSTETKAVIFSREIQTSGKQSNRGRECSGRENWGRPFLFSWEVNKSSREHSQPRKDSAYKGKKDYYTEQHIVYLWQFLLLQMTRFLFIKKGHQYKKMLFSVSLRTAVWVQYILARNKKYVLKVCISITLYLSFKWDT